jgi:hypothetical protein
LDWPILATVENKNGDFVSDEIFLKTVTLIREVWRVHGIRTGKLGQRGRPLTPTVSLVESVGLGDHLVSGDDDEAVAASVTQPVRSEDVNYVTVSAQGCQMA